MARIAIWQGEGGTDVISATRRALAAAQAAGAGLLLLPEGWATGYHRPGLDAATLGDVQPLLDALGGLAREAGLWLVCGTALAEGERLRNAALVWDDQGREVGRYAKRALFGDWEQATFTPGTEPLRFDWAGLRIGLLICYDVEFPELVRDHARAGCDLVLVPTALMTPYGRVATQMVPVRALESGVAIAYANRAGAEAGLVYEGLSVIPDAAGQELARAGTGPELLVAEIRPDPAALRAQGYTYLRDLARLEGL